MSRILPILSTILLCCATIFPQARLSDDELRHKAVRLAHEFIIVDGHVDIPYRLHRRYEDISRRTARGDFDYVRAREGGLDAPFMSVYIPSELENKGAKALADSLIDMVEGFQKAWPDKFAVAASVDAVRSQFAKGLISLPMGMENGSPLEGKIENVKYFYDRGIRYITLTHAEDNHICDSSYDTTRTWKGLSPFGRQVVQEMNRLGIMVDVSHISDDAFYQVMEIAKAPVIASHSSCRHFTPGFERNMSDEMIELLAKNGGVILINFGSSFLSKEYLDKEKPVWDEVRAYLRKNKLRFGDPKAEAYIKEVRQKHDFKNVDISAVADHIDHVVQLVGVDHVGFGSDFDGVGESLPVGLEDASKYPNLIYLLLKRGYSDEEIRKMCGENALRAWAQVEKMATELQGKQSSR
ncbi:MAG: membrane dipeptidase [Ignavibacteriales bacterium]|nr:membrane dipeptidase [Ignavibacteriales bacterium]